MISLLNFYFVTKSKFFRSIRKKVHQELCRVRDEQKTFGKIKVNTEL